MTRRHARLEAEMILRMRRCRASGAMWAALAALLLHADADGTCYPGLSTIACAAGLDRRALTRALSKLEVEGVILRERHGRKPTRYRVLVAWEKDGVGWIPADPAGLFGVGAGTPLEVGAGTPLEVGAQEVAGRGESVSELGANTPPELKVLNTVNSEDLNNTPDRRDVPQGVTPPGAAAADKMCIGCGGTGIATGDGDPYPCGCTIPKPMSGHA